MASRWRYELMMNFRILVVVVGFSLLLPAWIGLSSGVPTLYAPLPALTILPGLMLSQWRLEHLAILIPTILFFLWNPWLMLNQRSNVPKRTVLLLAILTILAILDFVSEWNYGIQYRGAHYTLIICILNSAWLALVWWAGIRGLRKPSFQGNLLFHWLLFAWLAWYAFPYLGELP
jgi:hypothetical protein